MLVAYVCKRCCSTGVFPLHKLYEYYPLDQFHQCNPEKLTSLLKLTCPVDQVYHESVERLPAAFKSTVEEWVKGEKYLYADKIAPEYLQSISPNIMKYKVRPSALRKFTDDNKRNHYLQRTVEEAERNGWNSWTSIEDDELLDLVRNTWATGAVFTFLNEETGSSSDSYFIAIVPPHRISKKKQIDEQIPLMNQFGIPPEFIKQIVSGKFE